MTTIVVNKEVSKVITVSNVAPKVIVLNKGADGAAGVGVPSGGTTNQVLKKISNTSYDTAWATVSTSGDMLSTNNLSDVANVETARNNIGAVSMSESIVNALIFG